MNAIQKLEETVEKFCRFIQTIPEEELVVEEWGPKEVLAHLVYHTYTIKA